MVLATAAVLTGCIEPGNRDVIVAQNDSPERQEVEVFYLIDGEEQLLVPVPIAVGSSPGLESSVTGDCTKGTLVARYLDGAEVERKPPGVCVGTVWRINGDPAD
jgi:hypothetical protein